MARENSFSAVLIGGQTLLIQCAGVLLERGHRISAVVTRDAATERWAREQGIDVWRDDNTLEGQLDGHPFDFLFSIVNLRICPDFLIQAPARAAINFHDGLLPGYAGLNVTNWALLNGEPEHGVTWHEMLSDVDQGDIFVQQRFAVVPGETALTLNARCLETGLETFRTLVGQIESDQLTGHAQPAGESQFFGPSAKPPALASIDWNSDAQAVERLVNGLDFGGYPNPIACAKASHDGSAFAVAGIAVTADAGSAPPGTIVSIDESGEMTIATGSQQVVVRDLVPLRPGRAKALKAGDRLTLLSPDDASTLDQMATDRGRYETFWLSRLQKAQPINVAGVQAALPSDLASISYPVPRVLADDSRFAGHAADVALACAGWMMARLADSTNCYLPLHTSADPLGVYSPLVPARVSVADQTIDAAWTSWQEELATVESRGAFPLDLLHRQQSVLDQHANWRDGAHTVALTLTGDNFDPASAEAAVTIAADPANVALTWWHDPNLVSAERVTQLCESLDAFIHHLVQDGQTLQTANLLSSADLKLLADFNNTGHAAEPICIHTQFEAQAKATPDAVALVFENQQLTYNQVNRAANQWARKLTAQGVEPGARVGVHLERNIHLLPVMLGVIKTGAAYVPLDPTYPADRIAHMVEDSGATVVVSDLASLPANPNVVVIQRESSAPQVAELDDANPNAGVGPDDLAYVIYTSGSTGMPKGVMVEHRNVSNFFAGMDQRIDYQVGDVWLAVTSISFDISVLEIFWTLCRGFKVVLQSAGRKAKAAAVTTRPDQPMGFSLFFWNYVNDADKDDPDKYRLLMEAARFGDQNGFEAIWTPERHFGAFGGSYPNPSVISAALAATTTNIKIRAGSVVMPLHSAIRVAEDWSIVDNLSQGRVGISFAAGWQPNDFVIRPEGFENAKQKMFDGMDQVRRLWRGETVTFEGPKGPVEVATRPRPIQNELPVWVTTAGNPDSFRNAGAMGANLLTHLLGQTVEQVGDNIRLYREAWQEAGHEGNGHITLMLHTLVGDDEEQVRETAREPMKQYLKSAMFLVKDAAWEFPTFKKMSEETGKDLDDFFATISDEDMDGLLEFAFNRYYGTSGLFGSPSRCMKLVDQLKDIGVDEIGCLVDYGLANDDVLDHLPNLADLAAAANAPARDDSADYDAVNEQIERHDVTHMQCTPSQASMLANDPASHGALAKLRQLMVGGEALPHDLARSLNELCAGQVTNMYGPTETTIWSSTWPVDGASDGVSIGAPIANTQLMIVDQQLRPLPCGAVGELLIGGDGVVRGYHNRPQLTAERFVTTEFPAGGQQRAYRTGDSAVLDRSGVLTCLGRNDDQIKIRGYRIELGEIENALAQHEAVTGAVVMLREDTPGNKMLVGYYTARSAVTTAELRAVLQQRLPEFMVPAHLMALDEFPQTPNGKIQRSAMPAPDTGEAAGGDTVAPASGLESEIAAIWCELLNRSAVGVTDNFFDIGGHSLLAVQALNKIRHLTEQTVKMTDLFRFPTIQTLARHLGSGDGGGEPDEGLKRSEDRGQARRASRNRRRRPRSA